MNMNVGVPNSVPSYREMSVEEYKKMSFVPTKANLEKRRFEQDQQHGERKSMSDFEKDTLSTTSTFPRERASSQSNSWPEVRRLSGNFNAPTQVEVERHNETQSLRGFRGTIKGWMKKSPPPTIA